MKRMLLTLLISPVPARSFQTSGRSCSSSSLTAASAVSISDAFDGGNVEFLGQETGKTGSETVKLAIKKDPFTEFEQTNHFQYFSFRSVAASTNQSVGYIIENAGESSYASAWEGATVFYSKTLNNPYNWNRIVNTTYHNGLLSWTHTGSAYFSYFPPYSYNRHLELIDSCGEDNVMSLGQTLDGRELDCVKLGYGEKTCWIIHRQHPGESMAEFFAEGLLERLLGINGSVDGLVSKLLSLYTFYIVPNMCPDGSVRGHLRTNAGGQNLNREWASSDNYEAPSIERSPEVYHVLNKMQETGVDAFLDVHGDEELPYNFLAGSEGIPNWSDRLKSLHGAFTASYARANSDMQSHHGYEPDGPGQGKLNICSNQIAHRFDCFAATLEMPFKDCATNPDPERGWSPARAKQLGASALDALAYIYPYLRDDTEFWNSLPKDDDYVCPTSKYK